MRLLHSIRPMNPMAWVWGYLVGANGRPLTHQPGRTWDTTYHLYGVPRGDIPPRGLDRRYWRPYQTNRDRDREFGLNPLCGPLRSRSQYPRWYAKASYVTTGMCNDCLMIAVRSGLTAQDLNTIIEQDPWYQMRTTWPFNRSAANEFYWDQPDPVTGD